MIVALLEAGADVNARAHSGGTPLHRMAQRGDKLPRLMALLAGGADVNASDTSGLTPLHIAASRKNLHVVRALLEAGADVNARAADDDTPLHRVIASRNSPGTLLTIPYDAPPQLRDAGGPDDLAALDLDTAVVATLVRAGADLEAAQLQRGDTAGEEPESMETPGSSESSWNSGPPRNRGSRP